MPKIKYDELYYRNFLLNDLGLSEEQIQYLTEQYPISQTAVRSDHRKEGHFIRNWSEGPIALLYRSNDIITGDCKWIGISNNKSIRAIPTKNIAKQYNITQPEIDVVRAFIQSNFPLKFKARSNPLLDTRASKGEILVAEALKKMGVADRFTIKPEYQVPDLVGFENLWVQPPRYDFAILYQNNPFLFIEFDGEQHYRADKDFLKRYRRDAAKNAYAFYSAIPLVRIPYGMLEEPNAIDEICKTIVLYSKASKFMPRDNQ